MLGKCQQGGGGIASGLRPAAAHARQLNESRRTPTTPSLRRGQTERYGPTLIGRAEACEGGFQVRNELPAQNAPHDQTLLPTNISQIGRGHETS
jgi:hypothetical protein